MISAGSLTSGLASPAVRRQRNEFSLHVLRPLQVPGHAVPSAAGHSLCGSRSLCLKAGRRWTPGDTEDNSLAVAADPFAAAWKLLQNRTRHSSSSSSSSSLFLPSLLSLSTAFWFASDPVWALPGIATPLPLQILGFLLNHPVITLVIAGLAIWAIPRLARAAVRFILIPAAFLGVGYLVVTNPRTSFAFAGTALSYVSSHPVITSIVILVGLSFVLSPYILAAGASVLLVGGYKVLPSQVRFLIPAPVIEVDKQLTSVRQRLFRSGQELQREAPAVKADPTDIFGRLKKIASRVGAFPRMDLGRSI